MRKIRIFSQIVAIILIFSMLFSAQPWTVAAAEVKKEAEMATLYLSEVKMFYGRNESQAKSACEKEGFIFSNTNLNKGVPNMDSGASAMGIYLGYKVTEDIGEAITDLTLLDMKHTHFTEMSYEEYLDKSLSQFSNEANQLMTLVNEFRTQYAAGNPMAVMAYDSFNLIYMDEGKSRNVDDNLLGNYFLNSADATFFQKFLQRGNAMVLSKIVDILCSAVSDFNEDGTTWVDRAKKSELTFAYDKADSGEKNRLDASYQNSAKVFINAIQEFSKNYTEAKRRLDKYGETLGYDALKGMDGETAIREMDKAGSDCLFPEYCKALEIYALLEKVEYQKKNEVIENNAGLIDESNGEPTTQKASKTLTLARYIMDLAADETLADHPSTVYPIIQALTPAQRVVLKQGGFERIIEGLFPTEDYEAQRKEVVKKAMKNLEELGCKDGRMYLWAGTDQAIYTKKVAKTDALLEEQRAGTDLTDIENDAERKENDDLKQILMGIEIGSLVGGGIAMVVEAFVGYSLLSAGTYLFSLAATHIATGLLASIGGLALGLAGALCCALYAIGIIAFVVSIVYMIFDLLGGLDMFKSREEISYDNIPDIVFDARRDNTGAYEVRYDAVLSNAGKDIFGDDDDDYYIDHLSKDHADVNAFQSVYDRWITLYYSKSTACGKPIEVKEGENPFIARSESEAPSGYRPLTLINTVNAVNVNDVEVDEQWGKPLYVFFPGNAVGTAGETVPGKGYITDVILSVDENKDVAINFLKKSGYEYIDVNLTPGKGYTYLAYKRGTDEKQALRDLRVANCGNDQLLFGDAQYAKANLENRGTTPYGMSVYKTKSASAGSPIVDIVISNTRREKGDGMEPVCLFAGGDAVDFEHRWNDNILSTYDDTTYFTYESSSSDDDKYVRDGKKSVRQYISQEDPVNGKYIYFQPKVQYKAGENQQQYIAGFSYFLAGNEDAMANTYGNNYEFMQTFAKENGFELLMDGDEPFTTMSDSASEMTLTTTWRDVEGYPMDTYNFDMVHTMEKGNVIQQSDGGLSHGTLIVSRTFRHLWYNTTRENSKMIYHTKMYFGVAYTYNPYRAITGVAGLVTPYTETTAQIRYSGLPTPAGNMLLSNVSVQGCPMFAAGSSASIYNMTSMNHPLYVNYEASQKSDLDWMTDKETEIMTHSLLTAGPKSGMVPLKKGDILFSTSENPGEKPGYLPICDMRTPNDKSHPLNFALDTTNKGSKYLYLYQKSNSGGRTGEENPNNNYRQKKYVVGVFCGSGRNPEEAIRNLYAKAAQNWAGIASKHTDISSNPTTWEFDEIIPVDLSSTGVWYENWYKEDTNVSSLPNDEIRYGNKAAYYRWQYHKETSKYWGSSIDDFEINQKCAYIGVVRSDNDTDKAQYKEAVYGMVKYYTDAETPSSTLNLGDTETKLAGGPVNSPEGRYFLYYSTNTGTAPYSAATTHIEISKDIFINGFNTSFTVSASEEKNNRLPEYSQLRMRPDEYMYIHLGYDRDELPYYEKLFIGVGKTKAEAFTDLIGSSNAFAAMDVNCNYNSFSDKWIAIGYRRTSEKEDAIRDIFLYYGDKPTEDMEEIYIKKNTYSVEDDYEGGFEYAPFEDYYYDEDGNEIDVEGVPYTLLKHEMKTGEEIISLNEGNGGKGLYLYYTTARFAYAEQMEAEVFPITNMCFAYGDISPRYATQQDLSNAFNGAYYIRAKADYRENEFDNPHWESVLGVKGSPLNWNPSTEGATRLSLNEGILPGIGNSGWHTEDTRVYMYVDRADNEQVEDGGEVEYTVRKNAHLPEFGYYAAESNFGKLKQVG